MLPQFTLNARIIFFMMVMFATATTASLKKTNDVVIMLKNHERALHVNAGGKVSATDISLAQFFTMESVGDIFSDTFKIALYAKEVGRYLCFRKGKLVGMKNLTRDCHFIESLEHGYFLYANAYNPLWRVGFTRGLKPVGPRHWKRPQTLKRACFLFVKINAEHFDRNRFTTTTTTTTTTTKPRLALKKSQSDVGTLSGNYKLYDSKASIIDSNNNNHKRTKSANHGHRHRELNSESMNHTGLKTKPWPEKDLMEQRHRKRKHHVKMAASNNSGSSLQPKNLVRHHHDHLGNGERRRRQHQREEKERKLRLQNQRRHDLDNFNTSNAQPIPSATNFPSPSVAATTLAATASLAPSALNIVAMLAASRRKRGRRKKQVESTDSNTSTGQQAMDLQLVAQSPLQVQTQYDRAQTHSIQGHNKHEHNYHQQQQNKQIIAPVNSTTSPPKMEVKVQQQNHKYSNINISDSQLYNSNSNSINHSHSRSINSSRSSSLSSSSYSRSHILTRIKRSSLNQNINNNNDSFNNNYLYDNNYNNNNNNNNVNLNAIPALPKNYLSKMNNFNNNEYLMPTTNTRSSTDFKANLQKLSHYITKNKNSHHHITSPLSHTPITNSSLNTSFLLSDIANHNTPSDVSAETHRLLDKNNSNSKNNIHNSYVDKNSYNLSDNNLQQEPLVLNRFKPIYFDQIRSRRKRCHQLQTNIKEKQHYKYITNNYSPISSTSTTNQNYFNIKNVPNLNDFQKSVHLTKQNCSKISQNNQNATTNYTTDNATITTTIATAIKSYSHSFRYTNYNKNISSSSNNNVKVIKKYNVNAKITNSKLGSSNTNISNGSNNSSSKSSSSSRSSSSENSKSKTSSDILVQLNNDNYVKNVQVKQQLEKEMEVKEEKENNLNNNFKSTPTTTTPTTTTTTSIYVKNAYRHYNSNRILTILGQQHKLNLIILTDTTTTTTKNPNNYNYNNNNIYITNANTNTNEKNNNYYDATTTYANNDETFKRIQNKYEKIIVQYRSVVN